MKRNRRLKEPTAVYGSASRSRAHDPGPAATVEQLKRGLPMSEFDALAEWLDLSGEALASHLSISRSTLLRRRKVGHLDMLESDRLLRFARLFGRAVEVLGSDVSARGWLKTPARALAHVTPLSFAETEVGAREVENLLGRIEQGVFS